MGQQRMALRLPGMAIAPSTRGMIIPLERSTFCRLGGDQRGVKIRSNRGTLWVTQAGDRMDHVLGTGEQWTVSRQGLVLVQALSDAAVELTPADRRR